MTDGISRRQFLVRSGAGGAALFGGSALLNSPALAGLERMTAGFGAVWAGNAIAANLDPALGFDANSLQFIRNVYEGLLEYAPGSTTLRPALAQSYVESPDRLTYTFTIRPNVVFHDGTKLNAKAVATSLRRIQEINGGPASMMTGVAKITAVGTHTVKITLSAPDSYFPGVLPWLPVVSPAALAKAQTSTDPWAKNWFATNAAGTGPYMLKNFQLNQRIDIVQNPHYWQKWNPATPTQGSMVLVVDPTTRLQLLQNGQIDFDAGGSPSDFNAGAKLSNVAVLRQPGLLVRTMPLNTQQGPMQDPKFRAAIVKSFDYQSFLTYYSGYGQLANGPIPPGMPGYDKRLAIPRQDLAGAKALLSAGGYLNKGVNLKFVSVQGANFGSYAGLLLQNALKQFGITLETQALPWPQPATAMANPSTAFDISFLNVSANTDDPSGLLAEAYSSANIASKGGYNWSNYQNPKIDALIAKARSADKPRYVSGAIYEAVNSIAAAHLAIYGIAPENVNMVQKAWEKGARFDSLYDLLVLRFFYARKGA